jgi:hypothetical protein
MQWTMPPRVLQIVASLIVLAAVASFVAGLLGAPQRGGRLPGEKTSADAAGSTAIEATDATPLSNERIEGPPPPANDEADQAENKTEADASANAQPPPVKITPVPEAQAPPPPPSGAAAPAQTLGGPPAADEPPH